LLYDILFSGELLPGADPSEVKTRLQSLFKLSDEVARRLFSGQTLALKRGLDPTRAERLRRIFLEAGAVAWLVEQAPVSREDLVRLAKQSVAPHEYVAPPGSASWSLTPADDPLPLEPEPAHLLPAVDISGLRLITTSDWSLADCDRPPRPTRVLDISHLRILEPEEHP
jgi:hypothetical protein